MARSWIHLVLSTVLALATQSGADLPGGVCSIDDKACNLQDNIILIVQHVGTMDQCRVMCQDEPACNFISYFNINSFPFSETCMLMSACSAMYDCTDCRTEDRACLPCSTANQNHLGDNFLTFIPNMEEEMQCKAECIAESACNFYTYHNSSDPTFPATCFLLSALEDPFLPCDFCRTGPVACDTTEGRCFFWLEDGSRATSGQLITETSFNTKLTAQALGSCSFTVLAVGGGGAGGRSHGGGGGGSGYVTIDNVTLSNGIINMVISLGDSGRSTKVLLEDGEVIVEAMPGESGETYPADGGAGYSGGGGGGGGNYGGGIGGTDGGSGHRGTGSSPYGAGGQGSSLDVSSISATGGFQLSPGSGGSSGGEDSGGTGGGGGGIIITSSTNPSIEAHTDEGHPADGQGYGAGGRGDTDGRGKPGVSIITFK